jgi:ParB family chromosome partitioning protein
MASRNSNLLAKANSVDLDQAMKNATSQGQPQSRGTAPGQLIGLQGDFLRAQEKIIELQEQLATAGAAVELPLNEIYVVPGRKRILTEEQRSELKASLKQHPLLHPIIVLPKNDRGHELWAGHNRYELYGELGKPTIRAIIQAVEPEKVELYAFISNLLSPSLTDYEKFVRFKKRKEETGQSQHQLADETGLSRQSVSLLFSFGNLPEEALALIEENPSCLGATAADELASAAHDGRADKVVEAIRRLVSDSKFTQKDAVVLANQKPALKATPAKAVPVVFKIGKAKFGQIESRNGVIALKLQNAELTGKWAKKIEDFVRDELEKEKAS